MECYNCGGKGHYRSNCPSKKSDKPKKKKAKLNKAQEVEKPKEDNVEKSNEPNMHYRLNA